jgi:predicted nucleic acid-binding protein
VIATEVRAVVDANIVLALALPLPYSRPAADLMLRLKEAAAEIYAPAILEYELVSALRRAVAAGWMDTPTAEASLDRVLRLGVAFITPAQSLDILALRWNERLHQTKAYDAQYLALAEQMHCDLWTADVRLAAAATALGVGWVRPLQAATEGWTPRA